MKPSDDLEQLLKNLHLNRILDIYSEQLSAAEKEDVSYSEFRTRFLRAQWHHRQETALAWRIKRANLPRELVAGHLRRTITARSAKRRRRPWINNHPAAKTTCARFSKPIATHREPAAIWGGRTGCWPSSSINEPSP